MAGPRGEKSNTGRIQFGTLSELKILNWQTIIKRLPTAFFFIYHIVLHGWVRDKFSKRRLFLKTSRQPGFWKVPRGGNRCSRIIEFDSSSHWTSNMRLLNKKANCRWTSIRGRTHLIIFASHFVVTKPWKDKTSTSRGSRRTGKSHSDNVR